MSIIKKTFFPIFFFCTILLLQQAALPEKRITDEGWEYFYERGMKQFRAELYNDAYDSMKKALNRNPQLWEAANILGDIQSIRKERYGAIEYYTLSLSINDLQPVIHRKLGEHLEYYSKFEEALEHYRRGNEIDPDDTAILISISRAYRKLGRKDDAEKFYTVCREKGMAGSSELVKHADGMKATNPAGAVILYRHAIKTNPAHTEAYIWLSDTYRQLNEFEQAAAILEELKIINPCCVDLYIRLGNIYYCNKLKGNTRRYYIDQAVKNFEEAIKLQPENSDLYIQLADIMKATGEKEKADRLSEAAYRLMKEGK